MSDSDIALLVLLVWMACCSVSMGTEVPLILLKCVCVFTPCGIYIYETAHILFTSPDLLSVEVYLARCFNTNTNLLSSSVALESLFLPFTLFGFAGEICSLVSNKQMAPVF